MDTKVSHRKKNIRSGRTLFGVCRVLMSLTIGTSPVSNYKIQKILVNKYYVYISYITYDVLPSQAQIVAL